MIFSTLQEWLQWLETVPAEKTIADLTRIKTIANKLDLWPIPCPVITVTGTNGKGSCVALLTQILRRQGYHTGTYTSPHLFRYNERICIDANPVSDEAICDAFSAIENTRADVALSYFQFTTLAAFYLFKKAHLDVWILEVGIGGRLDPVNIIDADLAIISTVDLDHTQWLGNTRELIGREKAGIIRAGKPVICGDFNSPDSLTDYAREVGAVLYRQNNDFGFSQNDQTWDFWQKNSEGISHLPLPNIQLQNAATVLAALRIFSSVLSVSEDAIRFGLIHTSLFGRLQIMPGKIMRIFDVSHNPAATALLAKYLIHNVGKRRLFAVIGMLSDKDLEGTILPLLPLIKRWYVGSLQITRGANAQLLADILHAYNVEFVYTYSSVLTAYEAAMKDASEGDCVVVFGSFYSVAEVLRGI